MKSKKGKKASIRNNPDLNKWFSTSELLEYLGISPIELNNYSKLFIEGIHYRYEIQHERNSPKLWRIDLIDELLCLPIAPLEKEVMINAINNRIICNK